MAGIGIGRKALRDCRTAAATVAAAGAGAEIKRMLGLCRGVHRGFTVQRFHENLARQHNYTLGYTVTKLHLDRAGPVAPAKARSAHRKKRPRRPMVGMMLHQNASTHVWLAGDERKYDLGVTVEDATSRHGVRVG